MLAVALTGALVLLAALTLFQVALIFGAPLGRGAFDNRRQAAAEADALPDACHDSGGQ